MMLHQFYQGMDPLCGHKRACSDLNQAWSNYRLKQDEIVEHLLGMADGDPDVAAFVMQQLSSMVGVCQASFCEPVDGGHTDWQLTVESCELQPPPGDVSAAPEERAVDLLARLMKDGERSLSCDEVDDLDLLKRIMNDSGSEAPHSNHCSPSDDHISCKLDVSLIAPCKFDESQIDGTIDTNPRKTTVLIRLKRGHMTSKEVLDHLSSKYDVVCGRDVDYLYCPSDFIKGQIKGYAIINFRDMCAAEQFVNSWPECTWANRQGALANAADFLRKHSRIKNDWFRPLVWPRADDTSPTTLRELVAVEGCRHEVCCNKAELLGNRVLLECAVSVQ